MDKNYLEAFENVLKQLVLPMFPHLSDVKVSYKGFKGMVQITYYINDRIDYSTGYTIEKETNTLFNMMGFDKNHHPWVNYRSTEEEN